jgi:cation diffusion facilitator family transporter
MHAEESDSRKFDREKQVVAISSVAAAVLLTSTKLVVGIFTGSLGILSEAAHSGLDLVAALVTLFAVRVSGKPADPEHTYGHGKIENLSALFETVLLLGTCVWIVFEALHRIFVHHPPVDASPWAFLTVAVSIGIDISRSRALMKVARRSGSQALEADALHFSSDIWSSAVVFLGLILVRISQATGIVWLEKADAAAALGVAAIVILVSIRLGRRTVADLIDAVSPALRDEVLLAARVPGVLEVRQARIRRSGPELFADITVTVDRSVSLERAHDIATEAEAAIRQLNPKTDVLVHVDPVPRRNEGLLDTVRLLAARRGLGVHAIRVHQVHGRPSMEMHLEVDDSLTVGEAHDKATEFEQALQCELPFMEKIVTHLEPVGDASATITATPGEEDRLERALGAILRDLGVAVHPHHLDIRRIKEKLSISFHCVVEAQQPITVAHALTEEIEHRLRRRVPQIGRVVIHLEPLEEGTGWTGCGCEQAAEGAERERPRLQVPSWMRTSSHPPRPDRPSPQLHGKEPPHSS